MKKIIFFLFLLPFIATSQPNCNVFEDDCKKACEIAIQSGGGQGSRRSQEKFDRALEICPDGLAYAHMQKAVPYLKRGDFISWKKMIDKAVEIDPIGYLGYRGWCRFQFLRDYEGSIKDLERLKTILPVDIGYAQNGHYHLNTALALCYKKIGQKDKAIQIIEDHISDENYTFWAFEYLHLGVLYLETGNLKKAEQYLVKQIQTNDYLAETYYYLAMVHKELNNAENTLDNLLKAQEYYLANKRMFDVYTTPVDKIYLSKIEDELADF